MSLKLTPYPEYKDSGLPWLGEIPAHWQLKRLKFLFREVDDRSDTGHETLLSMRQLQGLVPHNDVSNKEIKSSELVGYKRTHVDDVVMNRMRASSGMFARTPVSGLVSPDYAVFRPLDEVNVEYCVNLFKAPQLQAEFRAESKGLGTGTAGFLRLYSDRFGAISIPLPSQEEQNELVAYIQATDKLINSLIFAKQRLIELLNEQKQAIIHHAVTRGLDPDAPMKSTGLDWMSEVPEHWEVKPLKRWAAINSRVLAETTDAEYVFRYLDIGAVGTGFLTEQPESMRFDNAPSRARRVLKQGDTIISTVRTYLKAVYFVADEQEDLIASTGFAVLTPVPGVVPECLSFVIQSNTFVERVMANSVGVAYPAIAETRLGALHLALPPTEQEQLSMVEYIKRETQDIDEAIRRTQREIDLIREYRTRLISDVVTGKLDVREHKKATQPRKPNIHFCRSVLAAEIVDRHQDTSRFGRIKLQKAVILAERHLRLDEIESKPQRAAAGPFDNQMMRSIHAQLERQKWFKPAKRQGGAYEYIPMEKRGGHRRYFERYWSEKSEAFDHLLDLLKPMSTERTEIIATLYIAWNDFLIRGEPVDDDKLVNEVLHHWDESKRRIDEDRWRKAITWMRDNDLVPQGFGTATTAGPANVVL